MQDYKIGPGSTEPPHTHPPRGGSFFFHDARRIIFAAIVSLSLGVSLLGQTVNGVRKDTQPAAQSTKNPLQRHYEAAQNFQADGNLQAAAVEYRLFLAEALHRVANGQLSIGDFAKGRALLDQALELSPADVDLRVDDAEACRQTGDLSKAKSLAETAAEAEPRNVRTHLVLARTLTQLNELPAATEQYEEAVAVEPNFDDGYALATAYLRAKEEPKAARVFSEMLASFGDSPEIHMKFGSAYGAAGYPIQSIAEFKQVIAKNPRYPGAHYSLGAAYLVGLSDAIYPQAAAEFRKELEINPNDFNSHNQLGYIELSQHKLAEAEKDLQRAAELDPKNPDPFLSLGQLLVESDRPTDAEVALRKAIALTSDVSRSHYQIQRAHYLLARLLLQSGRQDEGKAEMQISQELMQKSVLHNQGKDAVDGPSNDVAGNAGTPVANTAPPDPAVVKQVEAFENEIRPAVADAYNNLGAIAAGANDFPVALDSFQKAFEWNPNLEGLDFNWGKAAFAAGQFDVAEGPLSRYVEKHSDDPWARSALGTSEFKLKKYADAVSALRPIEGKLDAEPEVATIYAVSLIKTGQYDQGITRLRALEAKDPNDAGTHELLGEQFANHADFKDAADELRAAVRLDPSNSIVKYNLASALIDLHENDEAQGLLVELVNAGWQDPHAYFSLGKLQLERGDAKDAIANLEIAARMSPNSGPIHHELAEAYRQDSRAEDADREMKLYEALKADPSKTGGTSKPE
jgi:tetratricopeptide (TPR) repeat protein